MPYSAAKIANEFLDVARERGDELTPLKLLKLVYIAHGWSFPLLGAPLINEPAQAWQYGPVVPSLYHSVSQYRAGGITHHVVDSDPQELSPQAKQHVRNVYDTYGRYSGVQLSNLTHLPGTPWHEAWYQRGRNALIQNDRIAQHYGELLQSRGQSS
jgi:uncharacterized phage-associated protein